MKTHNNTSIEKKKHPHFNIKKMCIQLWDIYFVFSEITKDWEYNRIPFSFICLNYYVLYRFLNNLEIIFIALSICVVRHIQIHYGIDIIHISGAYILFEPIKSLKIYEEVIPKYIYINLKEITTTTKIRLESLAGNKIF